MVKAAQSDDDFIAQRLRAAGATDDELRAARTSPEALVVLAADIGIRPNGAPISREELARRVGVSPERIDEVRSMCGLRAALPGMSNWFESDAEWVALIEAGIVFLGEGAVTSLMRRAGLALSQLAHASSEAFRVNVLMSDPAADPGADVVNALTQLIEGNVAAGALMDGYAQAIGQLFRHHSRETVRRETRVAGDHGELLPMAIGFVDLAASTDLGERVDAAHLAELVNDFETAVFRVAGDRGVRVVKTIGDEAMFAADDPGALCEAALDLIEYCLCHPVFTTARAGVAFGDVLGQGGDCYGPTVNRAARFAQAAHDGWLMADHGLEKLISLPLQYQSVTAQEHRGLGVVNWGRVSR